MGKTSKGNAKILKAIGNGLMALSVVFLLIIFYPILRAEYLFRTTNLSGEQPVSKAFNVRIPSLKINAPVFENINPWKTDEYLPVLQEGVAHAQKTSLPDQSGTVFLFAHSSDVPWRITRYNTAFYRLGRINIGDQIIITYQNQDYHYQVKDIKTVWPNQIGYLENPDSGGLILQTCTPIGTDLKRLLVFAENKEGL